MSGRASAAARLWRARNIRTSGDRAYLAYLAVMVVLIAVVPVARAVWVSVSGAEGVAALTSPGAPAATMFAVATLWAGALLLGRDRGPALLPPFLTHTFATSDLPRSATFLRPVLRVGALVAALTILVSGLVGGSLLVAGIVEPLGAAAFIAAGALVGVITTVAWLIGQVFPGAAVTCALFVLALGAATAGVPAMQPFVPWGWVGLLYPGPGTPQLLAALVTFTAALVAAVPALMSRLSLPHLMEQAARWDSAATNASGMDFGAAASVYQRRPHRGRTFRAVRPAGARAAVFLIRDAIGASRTPGRLAVGILALMGSGALITLAFAPDTPGWALGGAAGLVLFAGLGPLTDGVRHAAQVAADLPLYGFSDERLLVNHLLFPLAVTIVALLASAVAWSLLLGGSATAPIVGCLALGVLALVGRTGNALKGPMPPTLLTPIPTPVGDLGAAVRLVWACDGVLFAAVAGASVALAPEAPLLLIGVAASLVGVEIHRWRRRA